jgi:hypothetical protein
VAPGVHVITPKAGLIHSAPNKNQNRTAIRFLVLPLFVIAVDSEACRSSSASASDQAMPACGKMVASLRIIAPSEYVRNLRIEVSMTSGPERPDAARGDQRPSIS